MTPNFSFFRLTAIMVGFYLLTQCTEAEESSTLSHSQRVNSYATPAAGYPSLAKNQEEDAKQALTVEGKPPQKMALLLPLTGPLAGPGAAIKDGFMAAYAANHTNAQGKVQFYNTYGANITTLYQQAIEEGADYIVGPLTKSDVAIVAELEHPVPTLLLNDLSTEIKANAYQFGLSPSSEARQVALRAHQSGHTRALIIAPAGTWGNEVVAAFSKQWSAEGGQVVDTLSYRANEDLDGAVKHFLRISESESRGKKMKQLLGQSIQSTPMRRQDFDMIFLLAYPSKAHQIMPLLRYYYASDVPVYATSSVYRGSVNAMKDKDLDKIIFCDMPWVFSHQTGNKNWPEQLNSYNRLYALGMDSYALTTQLNHLLLSSSTDIKNKSGVLYINEGQRVDRILAWGQFKQGTPALISTT